MIVGIPAETYPGERRVAVIPSALAPLIKAGVEIHVLAGAGAEAGFPDADFEAAGARVVPSRRVLFEAADVVLQIWTSVANVATGDADLPLMRPGQVFAGFCEPLWNPERARSVAERGATVFALDLIPRITRAQSMDALSSMATIAGYKAVLLAADHLPRLFPLMMTAAGTLAAARVFVVGAGVAGLQAIATARRLGARVEAYDVRPAVRDEVKSLGARFVELPIEATDAQDASGYAKAQDERFYERQRELLGKVLTTSDVVITTAVIPGRKAPILLTEDMVARMPRGAVVVDLAAERGGNCSLTKTGQAVAVNGVTVIGPVNVPSSIPTHASQMYARNIVTFVLHAVPPGRPLNLEDQITAETLIARDGKVVNKRVLDLLGWDVP
jgi:NAD(P) transhydrogenase subunit alpha